MKHLQNLGHFLLSAPSIPELDWNPKLDANDSTLYHKIIVMLRWETEVEKVNILLEMSIFSHYQGSNRELHLKKLIHIFVYINNRQHFTLYFDQPCLE